ncbi:protein of unknown function (plasmid) [Shinella sp. WSC3-e]|nr:protein of unknown function [Shinella sp. WSC3-e]
MAPRYQGDEITRYIVKRRFGIFSFQLRHAVVRWGAIGWESQWIEL